MIKLHATLKNIVRSRAKRVKTAKKYPVCEECGGPRHSIHHIKRINDFEFSHKDIGQIGIILRTVNHIDNLIVLCEKCHRAKHKGFLEKEDLISLGIPPSPVYHEIFRKQWEFDSKEEVLEWLKNTYLQSRLLPA